MLNCFCSIILKMDLWSAIVKILIVFMLNFALTLGAGKNYPREYPENGMSDDRWIYFIQSVSGDNGITISVMILIFMTLHFLFMRGCGRYILRFFLPFYMVGFILLSLAIIIQVFGMSHFETVRILCYLFVIGVFTVMAFVTPIYFIWNPPQEELDGAIDPEQHEEFAAFIDYQASLQRRLRAIPLHAPPAQEQIDVGTDAITDTELTRQPDDDTDNVEENAEEPVVDTSINSEEDTEATSAEEEVRASSPESDDEARGAQEYVRRRTSRVRFGQSTAGPSSERTPRPRASLGRGRGSTKKPRGKRRNRR